MAENTKDTTIKDEKPQNATRDEDEEDKDEKQDTNNTMTLMAALREMTENMQTPDCSQSLDLLQRSWPSGEFPEFTEKRWMGSGGNPLAFQEYITQQALHRKIKRPIPDDEKDEKYWEKRVRNNEAARKSRENKRKADMDVRLKVVSLTEENVMLKEELAAIKAKFGLPINEKFGSKFKSTISNPYHTTTTAPVVSQGLPPSQPETTPDPMMEMPLKKRKRPIETEIENKVDECANHYNNQIVVHTPPSPGPLQFWGSRSTCSSTETYLQNHYSSLYPQSPRVSTVKRDTVSVEHTENCQGHTVSILVNAREQPMMPKPNIVQRLHSASMEDPLENFMSQFERPCIINVNQRESDKSQCENSQVMKTNIMLSTSSPILSPSTMSNSFSRPYNMINVNRRENEELRDQLHHLTQEVARMRNFVLKDDN